MRPVGFRFDVEAVVIDGVAHREQCSLVSTVPPAGTVRITAGDVYLAERCPRTCRCSSPFETLLGDAIEMEQPSLVT
jgi:hypothetical protein